MKLVDRMSAFSEVRSVQHEKINIHAVLDHVKKVSQAGFARHIRFHERYDPSLPPVFGNKDQLIQIFLNLVKNAAESIGETRKDGDIELTSAFRPGVRLQIPGNKAPVSLPLEFCVRDNGPGVSAGVGPLLVRSLCYDKGNRNWPGACFGRQDSWRSWWYHRMRILSPPHDFPGSHAHLCLT